MIYLIINAIVCSRAEQGIPNESHLISNIYYFFYLLSVCLFIVFSLFQNVDAIHMVPPGEHVIETRAIVFVEQMLWAEHVIAVRMVSGI